LWVRGHQDEPDRWRLAVGTMRASAVFPLVKTCLKGHLGSGPKFSRIGRAVTPTQNVHRVIVGV